MIGNSRDNFTSVYHIRTVFKEDIEDVACSRGGSRRLVDYLRQVVVICHLY